jgi:two-component system OmpR family response regulator
VAVVVGLVDLMATAGTGPTDSTAADVRILVVDDEVRLASVIRSGLRPDGFDVEVAVRGEDALWMARTNPYEAIVLDVHMPEMDGFEVGRRLRRQRVWSPVLMLTASAPIADRLRGLDIGADDLMTKPFSFDELSVRLRTLAERGAVERPVLMAGDLRLDLVTRSVMRGEAEVDLSAKETVLLELFLRNPGEVLTREQLSAFGWLNEASPLSNVVEVVIRHLRKRIDEPFGMSSIEPVRGGGYRLRA